MRKQIRQKSNLISIIFHACGSGPHAHVNEIQINFFLKKIK